MSKNWDEIQRLAAEFQKTQLSTGFQKLSERNCIEIVSLLIQKNLLEVFFTTDGADYVTPEYLEKEFMDELSISSGRVNLVEMSKSLNIDLSNIENIATKLANEDKNLHYILGQVIVESYLVRTAEEINEKLAQKGEINLSDLTTQFDLPADFLQKNVMEKYLGKIIKGRQDTSNSKLYYTQAYIQRCKARVLGALTAITRPISVASIQRQLNIQEHLFHSLVDELTSTGSVGAKLTNSQYIPHSYSKMQANWVNLFYTQNGFLEYDAVVKLGGITNVKQFIKNNLPNENLLYLKRFAVGSKIYDLKLVSALNECVASNGFTDLTTLLPSSMSDEDVEELFQLMVSSGRFTKSVVYLNSVVFSKQFLINLIQPCYELATKNARRSVENGAYQQYLAEKQLASFGKMEQVDIPEETKSNKREDRHKKSFAKKGAGNQSRESKTSSTKKHKRGGHREVVDSDTEDIVDNRSANKTLELVKIADIVDIINMALENDGLEHLSEEIAALYCSEINQSAVREAQHFYEATTKEGRKKTHLLLQENLEKLVADIRLYAKGLKALPHDLHSQLEKYLLKSVGNSICNELTKYMAGEHHKSIDSIDNFNADQRNKLAQEFDPEYRASLAELNKALNKTTDEFISAAEAALKTCNFVLKKWDRKKEHSLVNDHKARLLQQLTECDDYAIILHLTVLILFIKITGNLIHASGRFVSSLISFMAPSLDSEQHGLLARFHESVLKILQLDGDSEEGDTVKGQLDDLRSSIKELAVNYDKRTISENS